MKQELAPAVEVHVAATPAVKESASSSGEQQAEWLVFMLLSSLQIVLPDREPALAVELRVAATPAVQDSESLSKDEEAKWLIFMFPSSSQLSMKQEPAPAVELRVAVTPTAKDSESSSNLSSSAFAGVPHKPYNSHSENTDGPFITAYLL
jgi:hypothetical protein